MAINVLRDCATLSTHFFLGIALILVGLITLISRIPQRSIQKHLRPYHAILGSIWYYGVMYQSATSLWCRKDGFKWFIFAFMLILVTAMTVAHISIRIWQRNRPNSNQKSELAEVTVAVDPDREDSASRTEMEEVKEETQVIVYGLKLNTFKVIHGVSMSIAYAMLFGAGVMFSRRSKDLSACVNIYSPDDAVVAGAVFYSKDGALYLGGANFTAPI